MSGRHFATRICAVRRCLTHARTRTANSLPNLHTCAQSQITPFSPRSFTTSPQTRSSSRVLQSLKPGDTITEEVEVEGVPFIFEAGKLARLADGAVVCKYGDTQVLSTAVAARRMDEGADFLPLQVDYREPRGAVGRIPNTFNRREGASKDREILTGRAIDRAIRPLFPKGYYYETQLMPTVLGSDGMFDPDVVCINASSAALAISDIPWAGPVGAVRVALVDGELVLMPSAEEAEAADLSLLYACTFDRALMIEAAGARGGVSERAFEKALKAAHQAAVQLIPPQVRLAQRCGAPKRSPPLVQPSSALVEEARAIMLPLTKAVLYDRSVGKNAREAALGAARHTAIDVLSAKFPSESRSLVLEACETIEREAVRGQILSTSSRCDGRGLEEVRPVLAEVGPVPVLHGSALFSRGDTSSLASVAIGSLDSKQKLDALAGPQAKRLMVHYGFPPFSVNEVGKVGGASRREVGHGALAEKALCGVFPPEEQFPFAVRVNSDTMGSNGSSSMAAACAGSLALMDAGVPVSGPVAGMSVGLVMHNPADPQSKYTLITDIQGLEDHHGDMDFKICGTREGITAVQLDIKPAGVPLHILIAALAPARAARLRVMDAMRRAIARPRDAMKDSAPRYGSVKLPKEVLGKLIGVGGENLEALQEQTAAAITIDPLKDGTIWIFAQSLAEFEDASRLVLMYGENTVEVGTKHYGKVVSVKEFGAIVELPAGILGLLHVSEVSHDKASQVKDVLKEGDTVEVLCIDTDPRGNVKLSRKALLPPPRPAPSP